MYHYVSAPPPDADDIRRDLSVTPERFAEHLAALQAQGYTSISLYDLVYALQVGGPLPERPIVLTFDDGYRDHYEHAFPILQEYGYSGTFFVITGPIDDGLSEYLTWEQVIEMDAAGLHIESHSHSHPDLRNRSADYLVWQLLGSKEAIEARTNKPVRFFCYPAGRYDAQAIEILRATHYWAAVTTSQGAYHSAEGLYTLERIRVRGSHSAAGLLAAIDYFVGAPVEGGACTTIP